MKTSFETWWADKGIKEYRDMCRTWEVQPAADVERVAKYTAWEAYSAGLTRAADAMLEAEQ